MDYVDLGSGNLAAIKRLLDKHQSIIPELHEQDVAVRDRILKERCPKCQKTLEPRVPSDPSKVFSGLQIQYEKVCPTHGVVR